MNRLPPNRTVPALGAAFFLLWTVLAGPAPAAAPAGELRLASIKPVKPFAAPHRDKAVKSLASGKFLVAEDDMKDPRFSRSVILIVEYGPQGAMGLVINRPTELKLSELMGGLKGDTSGLEGLAGKVYMGGPVGNHRMFILVRSPEAPKYSERVFGDLYISSSMELLRELAGKPAGDARYRVFAGYAGWAPFQLDGEVLRGGWRVMDAVPGLIFAQDPSTVFDDLTGGAGR